MSHPLLAVGDEICIADSGNFPGLGFALGPAAPLLLPVALGMLWDRDMVRDMGRDRVRDMVRDMSRDRGRDVDRDMDRVREWSGKWTGT